MLKHLTRRIRRHWPRTRLTFRGDSHYGRTEAMAWCEDNGVDYIFGLAGNAVLHALAGETGEKVRARHAEAGGDKVRGFADFAYAAGSWNRARRVVARLEATTRGFDARYIVTSLTGAPRHLYEGIYCERGQAENLIKLHKSQLASDRTSCQSPLANQFRLVLHTAAYWLMLALRDAVPRRMPLHWVEFATLRQKLLKIGARVVEKAARIRIHFTSACLGQAEPALRPAQQDQPTVRRDRTADEIGGHLLAAYGWKIEREKGIFGHGGRGAFVASVEVRWTTNFYPNPTT